MPHHQQRDGTVRFDVAKVQRWRLDNLQPRSATMPVSASFSAARTRKETALAGLRELELRKKRGELVEVVAVQKEAFACGRQTRDAILSIPDRLSGVLVAKTDRKSVV